MKTVITAFVVIALAGFLSMPQAEAQRGGFIAGIAQPPPSAGNPVVASHGFIGSTFIQPFATAPVQPFVTAPVQPFFTAPVQPFLTAPVQPFGRNAFPPARSHQGRGQPAAVIAQPSQGFFFAAGPPTAPIQPADPLTFGTPRAVVVSRLGPPLVSVFTTSGETLYFNGGVTVYIQNGEMARPR